MSALRFFVLALFVLGACAHLGQETAEPDHLVILVFDAMRPDYIDRFSLPSFRKLRETSRNYREAYLGYLGAETVVSHLVIGTGLRPRALPWQDDVLYDVHGSLGPPGSFYATGGLGADPLFRLMRSLPPEQFLARRLKDKVGGSVFAVGEKNYAALIFGTPEADTIVTLRKTGNGCEPDGVKVPKYIVENPRFRLECAKKYGTESTYYPLDGSHFVPGDSLTHSGGDRWVTDVAKEIMKDERWSGLFLTYGAIDKVAHMLGEQDGTRPPETRAVKTEYDLARVARIADEQLGIILDELQKRGLLERTLLVVTADHGGQTDVHYLGNGKSSKWGQLKNETVEQAPRWVSHFARAGDVRFSFQDSAIRTWLATSDEKRVSKVIRAMSEVPGVTEIYRKTPTGYERVFSRLAAQSPSFRAWASHSKELLDAMAAENAPDLVGLLADGYGFDLIGDHGGAQEHVQRIPLFVRGPRETPETIEKPIRLYELNGTISERLGLKAPPLAP